MNRLLLAFLLLFPSIVFSQPKPIVLCMDDNWFPYTIFEDGETKGIHTKVIKHALDELGYTYHIKPKPWKRCLLDLENGKVDAVFPASYKASRAEIGFYPPEAATDAISPWRLSQVEHALITHSGTAYDYDGDISSIPQPIGMGLAGAFTDTLEKKGLKVKRNRTAKANIEMLMRGRIKSVSMAPLQAAEFLSSEKYSQFLKQHKLPLRSKSYFLIFAKNTHLSKKERLLIWNAIAKTRCNENLMPFLIYKYFKSALDDISE